MPSIRELVAQIEANRADAFSVVSGSAVSMTIAGSTQNGPVLGEAQLNALIENDLNQDQQTDIMVGRPVGLSMDLDGVTWRVLVQPTPTGLTLRGTREGSRSAPVVAAAPARAAPSPADSFGMGVPLDDDEAPISFADVDNPPTPPPGSLDAFERRGVPQPVAELHTPPPAAMDAFDSSPGSASPGGAFAQDDGFGMVAAPVLSAEERETTLFETPSDSGSGDVSIESTLLQSGGAVQAPPPDPTDPNPVAPGSEGTILMHHKPRVHPNPAPALAPEPAAEETDDILLADSSADHPEETAPTRQMRRVTTGSHRKSGSPSGTLMAIRPPGMKGRTEDAPAQRERSPSRSIPRMPTGQHPRSGELEIGALCFCREFKEAFEAGGRIGMGVEVIGESDIANDRGPTVENLGIEPGATLIVNIDDPSRLLGWVLLRREEGFRVFVITRATGPEGARRILLGVHGTQRAEAWLDAHPVYALVSGVYQPV